MSPTRSWQYPLLVFGGFSALWVLVMTAPAHAVRQSHLWSPSQATHAVRSRPATPHALTKPPLVEASRTSTASQLLGPDILKARTPAAPPYAVRSPGGIPHVAPASPPQSLWAGDVLVACGFLGFATYVARRQRAGAQQALFSVAVTSPQEGIPCLTDHHRQPMALCASDRTALVDPEVEKATEDAAVEPVGAPETPASPPQVADPEAGLATGTPALPTAELRSPPAAPSPSAAQDPKERDPLVTGSATSSTLVPGNDPRDPKGGSRGPKAPFVPLLEPPPASKAPRSGLVGRLVAYAFTACCGAALGLALRFNPHLYPMYLIGWVAAATMLFHNRNAYARRVSPELLCFLATSVWASLGFTAGLPVDVDLAFDYFLPGSLALSLLLQAPAPKAQAEPPKPPKPAKATKPVRGLVSSRAKKAKPAPPPPKEGSRLGPMFAALCFGAVGTITGALLTAAGMQALGLGVPPHLMALSLGCLTASYIGGTANFFETVRLIGPDPEGLQYVTVLAGGDVAVMGLYFFVLRLIHQFSPDSQSYHDTGGKEHIQATNPKSIHDVALLLLAGTAGLGLAGLCAVFAHLIPLTSVPLVLMIFTAYGIGAVLQRTLSAAWKPRLFNAIEAAAELFMNMFFATLGATATLQELERLGATAIGSMSAVLAVHLSLLMAGRWAFNKCMPRGRGMDTDTMLVASNACAGGAATAASMAESIKRPDLTIPAITVGLVGYVAGTRIGLVMYKFLLGVL